MDTKDDSCTALGLSRGRHRRAGSDGDQHAEAGARQRPNKEILTALERPRTPPAIQCRAAVNKLKTDHTPAWTNSCARADYDRGGGEGGPGRKETARNAEIEAEITKALEAGKITPATKEYHVEQCKAEGGLERFRKYVEAAPEIARNTEQTVRAGAGTTLTGDAAKIASMFGHKAEDLKKYR